MCAEILVQQSSEEKVTEKKNSGKTHIRSGSYVISDRQRDKNSARKAPLVRVLCVCTSNCILAQNGSHAKTFGLQFPLRHNESLSQILSDEKQYNLPISLKQRHFFRALITVHSAISGRMSSTCINTHRFSSVSCSLTIVLLMTARQDCE